MKPKNEENHSSKLNTTLYCEFVINQNLSIQSFLYDDCRDWKRCGHWQSETLIL